MGQTAHGRQMHLLVGVVVAFVAERALQSADTQRFFCQVLAVGIVHERDPEFRLS